LAQFALLQAGQFAIQDGRIHEFSPEWGQFDRTRTNNSSFFLSDIFLMRGPGPLICEFNQAPPHRVSLHETHHRQKVCVFLDDERPETVLPQVAFGFVDLMMMVGVTTQQPLDPPAEIADFFRLQDYVEMIGQQAVGENFHRMDLLGLSHQFNEELIVLFRPENSLPIVSPVINVVDKTTSQSPAGSGQTLLPLGKFPVPILWRKGLICRILRPIDTGITSWYRFNCGRLVSGGKAA
jgi:hypothetical protein